MCTPPAVHAEPAIAALRQGLAVYLEKPLARSADDGEAIVAAWRESGGVCAVGYQWRSLALLGRVRDGLAGVVAGHADQPQRGADRARPCGVLVRRPGRERRASCSSWAATTSTCSRRWPGRPSRCRRYPGRGLGAGGGALDDAVAVLVRYAGGGLGVISVAWTEQQEPPIYELDVLAPEVALHLALDPEFRLAGRAHDGTIDEKEAADPRTSAVTGFLDAARRSRSGGGGMHAGGCAGHAAGGAGGGAGDRQRGDGQAGRLNERATWRSQRAPLGVTSQSRHALVTLGRRGNHEARRCR